MHSEIADPMYDAMQGGANQPGSGQSSEEMGRYSQTAIPTSAFPGEQPAPAAPAAAGGSSMMMPPPGGGGGNYAFGGPPRGGAAAPAWAGRPSAAGSVQPPPREGVQPPPPGGWEGGTTRPMPDLSALMAALGGGAPPSFGGTSFGGGGATSSSARSGANRVDERTPNAEEFKLRFQYGERVVGPLIFKRSDSVATVVGELEGLVGVDVLCFC